MRTLLTCCVQLCVLLSLVGQQQFTGFFDFSWDPAAGKIWLDVTNRFDEEFLYVNALSAGVGSNDIGLDRNQLGDSRIVRFYRSGPKVLLIEPNLRYRAISDNAEERRAVEEAFATSVLWGFALEEKNGRQMIDLTPFLLRDAHGVSALLERTKQGSYQADESRSAINPDRTRSFPLNTEFESMVTFAGKANGAWIRSVTPDPDLVTVGMHHSFVRLPDDGYRPRKYDPRSGSIPISFYDYAAPIDQPLEKKYVIRFRLEKKEPAAAMSEAVKPIIYYLDRGCPEPVRSALLEGAGWWNQAFEAAGYQNAFQVRELPEGADPLDIRYNMINWVHRSTRGWSYGTSVVDPRTGEILKGVVLLGSLRVRQDYLIAQGIAGNFGEGHDNADVLVKMALQRLKQLSAHEVGHTLGFQHNFASSTNDRASVMDYPHPLISLGPDGEVDLSRAYATGIGAWDKRAVLYAYQDFPEGTDEDTALNALSRETLASGLRYLSDADARPAGSAHPLAHLWDNGSEPIAELNRISLVRAKALATFDAHRIPDEIRMAYLEDVLMPLYYSHRYQVEAVAKMIAGVSYTYAIKGDGQPVTQVVPDSTQKNAAMALLATLRPEYLRLDQTLIRMIPPPPVGFIRGRELPESLTGGLPDPITAARSSVGHTCSMLLHPDRLARCYQQGLYGEAWGLHAYLETLGEWIWALDDPDPLDAGLIRLVQKEWVTQLIHAAMDSQSPEVISEILLHLRSTERRLTEATTGSPEAIAHILYLRNLLKQFREAPERLQLPQTPDLPPGSPIGCGE